MRVRDDEMWAVKCVRGLTFGSLNGSKSVNITWGLGGDDGNGAFGLEGCDRVLHVKIERMDDKG